MDLAGQKRQRIVTLDIMRGYFLIMIIINHLYFFPSIYELITGRGELWVSAAEGFFLISGMLVGYIYTRKMAQDAPSAVKRIYKRVFILWIWAAILTTISLAWAHTADGRPLKEGFWWRPEPLEYIYKVLTLQYNYGWADFLQYYVLFMLFAPLAVWLCIKRKAWLVVLISVLIWAFRGQNFNMAWQLLFMCGIVIGYYLPRIEGWYRTRSEQGRKRIAWAIAVPALITLVASIAIMHGPHFIGFLFGDNTSASLQHLQNNLLSWRAESLPHTDKWSLAPARLALIALWFSALYLLVRTNEARIDKWTFGVLRTIGEVSLLVYGVHALVILGMHMYFGVEGYGFIGNTLITSVIIAAFYFGVKYRLRAKSALKAGVHKLRSLRYTH